MDARIRHGADAGFTLVELLVVMIIIGILAAIAVPLFARQRESAIDASMHSDLHNAATLVEGYRVENAAYPGGMADIAELEKDPDTILTLSVDADGQAFCLVATRAPGAAPGTGSWSYDSNAGGLLGAHAACS